MKPVSSPSSRLLCLALWFAVFDVLASASLQAADQKPAFETRARQTIVIDGETGTVLYEKSADTPFPPASLAKLMTMEVVFEALEAKRLDRSVAFVVGEHAWRTGGAPSGTSTMFAQLDKAVPLEALMQGVVVQAANDAAIAIAEGMGGSEAGFAAMMNESAAKLDLAHSHFVNPTGLPADGQSVTARDLSVLARHIEEHHSQYYRLYSQPAFEWNKITQRNRNPLLALDVGATGMATGYTEASGYSLVGLTEKSGRKTIVVLGGLSSARERAEEAKKLIDWSTTSFRREQLFAAGETVGQAAVYGGTVSSVPLATRDAVVAIVPQDRAQSVTARIAYDGPLRAPVARGTRIGSLDISIDGRSSLSRDVFAATAVEEGTFTSKALDAAEELAFGWFRAL